MFLMLRGTMRPRRCPSSCCEVTRAPKEDLSEDTEQTPEANVFLSLSLSQQVGVDLTVHEPL